jgi:hypothetical protein
MTRLQGTDLGHVLHVLSTDQLRHIAGAVADAQTATARLGRGTGFGYASTAAAAPHARWTDVVQAHVERSRRRIVANGLFPTTALDHVNRMLTGFGRCNDNTRIPWFAGLVIHCRNVPQNPVPCVLSDNYDVDDLQRTTV